MRDFGVNLSEISVAGTMMEIGKFLKLKDFALILLFSYFSQFSALDTSTFGLKCENLILPPNDSKISLSTRSMSYMTISFVC